jgi:hypothetical protein
MCMIRMLFMWICVLVCVYVCTMMAPLSTAQRGFCAGKQCGAPANRDSGGGGLGGGGGGYGGGGGGGGGRGNYYKEKVSEPLGDCAF